MSQFVPCTTAVKRNRARGISSDRLARRHQFLLGMLFTRNGRDLATRMDFAMRAAEFCAVERVLMDRGHVTRFQLDRMRDHALAMAPQ